MKRIAFLVIALLSYAVAGQAQSGSMLCNPPSEQLGTAPGTCVGTFPDISTAASTIYTLDTSQAPITQNVVTWTTTANPASVSVVVYASSDCATSTSLNTSSSTTGSYVFAGTYCWVGVAAPTLSRGVVRARYMGSAGIANIQASQLQVGTTNGHYLALTNSGTASVINSPADSLFLQTGTTNGLALDGGQGLYIYNKLAQYHGVNSAGLGLPAIYVAPAISATKTANFTIASYVPPAVAGVYEVAVIITTTSATNTGTVQATVDYVDSQGTAHTADVIPLVDAAGSVATTKSGASKEFHSLAWTITTDASATAIVPKVVITGTVSYTVTATVKQVA